LSFERWTEKKKGKEVKEDVDRSVMEKESGEKAPVFMSIDYWAGIELAEAMQGQLVGWAAGEKFENEDRDVDDD
jgi:hypothetical protein